MNLALFTISWRSLLSLAPPLFDRKKGFSNEDGNEKGMSKVSVKIPVTYIYRERLIHRLGEADTDSYTDI